jgi:Cu(I)/Ag(I) efflux system membrane fusion protein
VSAFDAKAFACCDSPEAQAVVDAYLRAQAALAKDDAAGAQAAAKALADKADALAKTAPERDRPWLATIATGARALGGQDLVAARESFKAVSNASLDYARAHTGGATRVAKAYCPMADASWLQREPIVSNPYYGAEMPTCGSFP